MDDRRGIFPNVTFCLGCVSLLLVALGVTSCADEGPPDETLPEGEVHALTLWNRSQFEILRVVAASPRGEWPEQEIVTPGGAPLEREAALRVEGFVSGSTITFERERASGGAQIAVSTLTPVYVDEVGYTLVLFDDSFRLLYPWSESNPYGTPEAQGVP